MIRKSGLSAVAAAGVLSTCLFAIAPLSAQAAPTAGTVVAPQATKAPDLATATLRQLAAHTGMKFGTAVANEPLVDPDDPTYAQLAASQFDLVTAENVMKWDTTEPSQGQFNFAPADTFMAFAAANKQTVRGHTLLWHNQLPAWLTEGTWTKAQLLEIMRQHIVAEVGRYKGKIWAWDVLNEAFNEDGTYRDTIWLRVIGPDYIAKAFTWAHEADPKAILFYNDYNIEGVNPKSDAVYAMAKTLRAKGVPIQAVGVQGHLSTEYDAPDSMPANLARFAKLGMYSAVTEADVRSVLPMTPAKRQSQANGYSVMLASCLLEKKCISFTVWGFTDKVQWVPGVFEGEGYAALWDDTYQTKPATEAVRRLLALAPNGKPRGPKAP